MNPSAGNKGDIAAERSRALFDSGMYCAESVLQAVAEVMGIQSDLIPRIATGFCGGVSHTCRLCGALSGAVMAINIIHGRQSPEESVTQNFELVKKVINRFVSQFGASNCQELISCDLGTDEGQSYFIKNNLVEKCKDYTAGAVRIVIQILESCEE